MTKRVATIGLLAFLALDIVLVVLALRPPRTTDAAPTVPTPVTTSSTSVGATPTTGDTTSTGSTSTTGTGSAGSRPAPLTVIVNGLDATVAWKATTGTCGSGGATLAVTKNGGARWSVVKAPTEAISRVQPLDTQRAFVVGASTACRLRQYSTTDLGSSWTGPSAVSGGWARRLDQPSTVVTPAQDAAQPCGGKAVVDLSRTSAQQAQALCVNGDIVETGDGGQTWVSAGKASEAVALANRSASGRVTTYVARVVPSCDGVQIARVADGKDPVQLACVATTVPATPGRIAISTPDEGGWLVVGDETFTGTRDLKAWTKA
ncbi:hypothetical protein N865_03115 [Intrasporangium oryzae NRRL B-24470]|uniref:Photosynthesis system II assembly factor Ycf48/Hcf136-like domain-containing protein n=1 Tax=Intrasporangium oryzae NRRL B-24470 TaxID=1386089 RepID=W9GDF7_9MICO|nr:hypothetical protein [Intrasporangium oryzae]EWT02863.1 hypothetical protein N865_03115 [Intrasporangium oryzae NRRL B-24470]